MEEGFALSLMYVVLLSETLVGHTGWPSLTVLYGVHGPWRITPARGTVVPLIDDL